MPLKEVSEERHARIWYESGSHMLNPLLISLEIGKQFIAHANNAYEEGETGVSFDVGAIALPRYRDIYLPSCRRIDDLAITPEDVITDAVPAKELLTVEYPGEQQMINFGIREWGNLLSEPLRSAIGINDDFLCFSSLLD
ncbi:hypothetical protein D1P53_001891 [Cryptococcus gattii VGV]|nr:hypothetical protein D1P53_001891 [Cryptococcus gattii VGV]